MKPKPRLKPRTGWLSDPTSCVIWSGSDDLPTAIKVTVRDARDPSPEAAARIAAERVLQTLYDSFVGFSSSQARISAIKACAKSSGYAARIVEGRVRVKPYIHPGEQHYGQKGDA